jgi:hypothetical protein
MRFRARTTLTLYAAALLCACLAVVNTVLTQVAPAERQAAPSLREKARRPGGATLRVFPRSLKRYDDLEALAGDSQEIVRATAVAQASALNKPSESMVSTDYKLAVEEVLKGGLKAGDSVSVNMLGGKVLFEDGASVNVQTPDYWKTPQVGKTYLLFLAPRQQEGEAGYQLVGGPQGLFEVSAGGIAPQGLESDKLLREHKGLTLKSFTRRVRAALASAEVLAGGGAAR